MTTTIDTVPELDEWATHVGTKFITFYSYSYDRSCYSPFDMYDGQGSITSFTDNQKSTTDKFSSDRADYFDEDDNFILPANSLPLDYTLGNKFKWFITHATNEPDGFWTADQDALDNLAACQKQSNKVHTLEAYCEQVLNEYNLWYNGEVYIYEIKQYVLKRDEDGVIITTYEYYRNAHESITHDVVGGYIGMDNFQEEFLSDLNSAIREEAA